MSKYIELQNRIKTEATLEWLTPSQKAIYENVTKGLKTHKIVNIYGAHGVGKTFLGWILAKEHEAEYFASHDDLQSALVAVLDNFDSDRRKVRRLRAQMHSLDIRQLFLITHRKVEDEIPAFELQFTEADRTQFKRNLFLFLDFQVVKEEETDNMHDLIMANI
jgi:hypothetical protein